MNKLLLILITIFVLVSGCGPTLNQTMNSQMISKGTTTNSTPYECIIIENSKTRWSAISKSLAVVAPLISAAGVSWVAGAIAGACSVGSAVIADGKVTDYLLMGCPTVVSTSTGTVILK